MKNILQMLKDNSVLAEGVEDYLKFSSLNDTLPFKLFENDLTNADHSDTNRRYSNKMKEFCLTRHFYYLKVYKFVRKRSTVPDKSSIRKWIAT